MVSYFCGVDLCVGDDALDKWGGDSDAATRAPSVEMDAAVAVAFEGLAGEPEILIVNELFEGFRQVAGLDGARLVVVTAPSEFPPIVKCFHGRFYLMLNF